MKSWGFTYKTCGFNWVKRNKKSDMEHSRKPDEIRERIKALCGDVPRIELFNRRQYDGWVCLGNEIDGKDIRDAIMEIKRER